MARYENNSLGALSVPILYFISLTPSLYGERDEFKGKLRVYACIQMTFVGQKLFGEL